jgi:hypothetical protein
MITKDSRVLSGNRDKTIGEFCDSVRISPATFYKLEADGLGPDIFSVPGTRIKRITAQAEAEWRERMQKLAMSKAAKIAEARRHKQTVAAAKKSAASPRHVSRRAAAKQST